MAPHYETLDDWITAWIDELYEDETRILHNPNCHINTPSEAVSPASGSKLHEKDGSMYGAYGRSGSA